MSEKRIKVPDGMLYVADRYSNVHDRDTLLGILQNALRWWTEYPIVPKDDEMRKLILDCPFSSTSYRGQRWMIEEWQRRMFVEPEPEVPTYEELLAEWRKVKDHQPNVFVPGSLRMEEEVPEEIREFLYEQDYIESESGNKDRYKELSSHNRLVLQAYRLGQQSKECK